MKDEIRRAVWQMVSDTGTHQQVAERASARFGWTLSHHAAVARVSQWLSPSDAHQLPADMLPDIVEIVVSAGGRDLVTPILRRARDRAEDARDADADELRAERRGPVRSRPRERRGVA